MPIHHRFTDEGLGLCYEAIGRLEEADIQALRAATRPQLASVRYVLADLRQLEVMAIDGQAMQRVADEDRRLARDFPDIRLAIVGQSDFAYGMARLYQSLFNEEGWEVLVSRDMTSAQEWLSERVRRADGEPLRFR